MGSGKSFWSRLIGGGAPAKHTPSGRGVTVSPTVYEYSEGTWVVEQDDLQHLKVLPSRSTRLIFQFLQKIKKHSSTLTKQEGQLFELFNNVQ